MRCVILSLCPLLKLNDDDDDDDDILGTSTQNKWSGWWRGPAVEHRSLAGFLSLSFARLAAGG